MRTGEAPQERNRLQIGKAFNAWNKPLWWISLIAIFLFLLEFLALPMFGVAQKALTYPGDGSFSLRYVGLLFDHPVLREAILNSAIVALGAGALATLAAMPFSIYIVRRKIHGAAWFEALGLLPLFVPPFLAATSLQLLLGANGIIDQLTGLNLDFMEGLFGLVLVEAIHYLPLILLLSTWALRSIDSSLLEAARGMGTREWRIHVRIALPICFPALTAGMVLIFSRVIDDLGAPLMMGVKNMIAPLIYLRITSTSLDDPVSACLSLMQMLISLPAWWFALRVLYRYGVNRARFLVTASVPEAARPEESRRTGAPLATCLLFLLLAVCLMPHLVLLLLSFSEIWSYSALPQSYTLENYSESFHAFTPLLLNTLTYCGLASVIGGAVGCVLAYLLSRSRSRFRNLYKYGVYLLFAIPGSALATGYLMRFMNFSLPLVDIHLSTTGLLIAIAYSIRSLPFSIWIFLYALQRIPPDLELAASGLGARPGRVFLRVLLPLLVEPFFLAMMTSFIISAMDLSLAMLLVPNESLSPVSHGIYLYLHTATERGMGAAMSMLLLLSMTIFAYLIYVFTARRFTRTAVRS